MNQWCVEMYQWSLAKLKGRCGFWITFLVVLLPFAALLFLTRPYYLHILWYVFSGKLFAEKWGIWMARGSLDQTGIFKMYFWFVVFSVLYFPWLTVVRFFADRKKRSVYWVFVIGSQLVIIFLLCLLTIGSWWLLLYIANMGTTFKRTAGVVFAFSSYCSIILYLIWAYLPVRHAKEKHGDLFKP